MRKSLRVIVMILLIMFFSGLSVWAAAVDEGESEAAGAVAAGKYSEAPMLARLVAQGKLPPVEERLPEVPLVAGPGVWNAREYLDWTPGKYSDGRPLRTVATRVKIGIMHISTNNFLWAPDQSSEDLVPVLVEEFSFSDDYTVFDFTIRKGLKWSNGDLVTTEDVRFTFDDLYEYPEAEIAYPSRMHSQGNVLYPPAKLTIEDEYSFTLTFDRPYGYFLAELRSWISDSTIILQPSEYLKDYHPRYTDIDKLNAMAKQAGLIGWTQLLQVKAGNHWRRAEDPNRLGQPHFQAWSMVDEITEDFTAVERNPYYPWVDTEGQQLPYIDRIEGHSIPDPDAFLVKIVSGEIDYIVDGSIRLPFMPVYLEGAEQANYRVQLTGGFNSPPLLFINQDFDYENPDSQWQKLVQDPQKRFGKAVALSIDKNDVNESIFFGKYGMDDLVTTADYDPAQANHLLDQLGMTTRDSKGFRTYPDGSTLEITIMTAVDSPEQASVAQLCAQHLQAVGLNARAKTVAWRILHQKGRNNENMMTVSWNDGPGWISGISQDYLPCCGKGDWAPASGQYIGSVGKEGRQPPAYIQEFFDIHTARKAVPPQSPEGANRLAKLHQWFADNYVMIWPVGSVVQPNILSKDLRNIPGGDVYYDPPMFGLSEAAPQWYFDD